MTEEEESRWKEETTALIRMRTEMYTEAEKKNLKLDYLIKVMDRVTPLARAADEIDVLRAEVDEAAALLPADRGAQRNSYAGYIKAVALMETAIRTRYKLVPKGYYLRRWLPLGIAIGLPYGLLFNNIAMSIPFGLLIGLSIGLWLDRRAASENAVL